MYTKQNFQIAKIAKNAANRGALGALRVSPEETVACDGSRLTRVKTTGEAGEFAPFLMSSAQALEVAKAAGIGAVGFTPDTHVNGHVSAQVGKVVITDDKPQGNYPEIARIIPTVDETWQRVTFDVKYMKELMELHASSGKHVNLYFAPGKPMVLETTGGDGPDVQSLLMPCHDGKGKDGKPVMPKRY